MKSNHPSVFTHQFALSFRKPILSSELKAHIEGFMLKLSTALAGPQDEIVGHIKGLLTTHDGEYVMFNITSLREGVRSKGDIKDRINNAEFKVNIILYGIGLTVIETVFKTLFNSSFSNDLSLDNTGL